MRIIEALKKSICRVPGKAWLAVGGLLVAAFWLQQHDVRIRQQVQLKQLQNKTSAEVAVLRRQAAQGVRQANVENAKAIAKLEQRRQQVEQQNRQLAAQLARLRKQAQIQAGEVATLPISEIVTRVAAQLGLKAEDVVNASHGTDAGAVGSSTDMAKNPTSATAKTTRHPAAGASNLPPQRRGGQTSFADIAKIAISAPPDAKSPTSAQAGGKSVVLPLTSSGARKVETALVELNACRAESNVKTRQISACQARAETDEAEMKRLNASVGSLNQALAAKDKIIDQQASACKAELRAARGTFLGRLARVTEHVAVGLVVGVAIGVAVK